MKVKKGRTPFPKGTARNKLYQVVLSTNDIKKLRMVKKYLNANGNSDTFYKLLNNQYESLITLG